MCEVLYEDMKQLNSYGGAMQRVRYLRKNIYDRVIAC